MTSNLDKAFSYSVKELRLSTMKSSLKELYDDAVRSHDAIHQFLLLAPSTYPRGDSNQPSWHNRSAFLTYHWDTFDLAHSSYYESLLANYSAGFILLRATLELLIRGAFFECLAHKKFREHSAVLDKIKDKRGRRLKGFLNELVRRRPSIEQDFEETSVAIYDKTSRIIHDPSFRLSNTIMLKQLAKWGIFKGVDAPVTTVSRIYRKLSKDVHAHPDRTGIGRILIYRPRDLFKQKRVMRRVLAEYLNDLRKVADIGIVITMNLLKDNLRDSPEVQEKLRTVFYPRFRELGLRYSASRLSVLLRSQEID